MIIITRTNSMRAVPSINIYLRVFTSNQILNQTGFTLVNKVCTISTPIIFNESAFHPSYVINYGTVQTLSQHCYVWFLCQHLRAVWIALHEQVQAIDELDMATTRLRLRLPEEEVPDSFRMNIIEPAEVSKIISLELMCPCMISP